MNCVTVRVLVFFVLFENCVKIHPFVSFCKKENKDILESFSQRPVLSVRTFNLKDLQIHPL